MEVVKQMEDYFLEDESDAVESMFGIQGFSFAGSGQNNALAFVKLKDWDERKDKSLSASAVAQRAAVALGGIRDAMVFAFAPPAIQELGRSA